MEGWRAKGLKLVFYCDGQKLVSTLSCDCCCMYLRLSENNFQSDPVSCLNCCLESMQLLVTVMSDEGSDEDKYSTTYILVNYCYIWLHYYLFRK
jgi:hypothetical protein